MAYDTAGMAHTKVSECGRFVVVDALHVDRAVFETLSAWAQARGLRVQDAIQIAVCAFNDAASLRDGSPSRLLRAIPVGLGGR